MRNVRVKMSGDFVCVNVVESKSCSSLIELPGGGNVQERKEVFVILLSFFILLLLSYCSAKDFLLINFWRFWGSDKTLQLNIPNLLIENK